MRNRNLLLFLLLAVIVFGLWYFSHIVIYIVVAAILSLIGQPIDRFFSNIKVSTYRFSPALSAALTFFILLLSFFSLALFFAPLIMEEAGILSSMDRQTVLLSIQQPLTNFENMLRNFNIEFDVNSFRSYVQEKLISLLTITNLSLFFNQVISALGDFVIAFFAISFLTFFFLRDEQQIANTILSAVPEKYFEKAKNVWHESQRMLKRYFIGILIEVLLVITFLSAGLWLAGIKHALLIALFAGLMNVIPYVGPLIGAGFALFIGLTTNTDVTMLSVIIKICVVFPIVNLADAFLLQPMIYSSSVKAHPLEIFLVILAGATVGGIGGMILAVPSYTVIRVIAKEFFNGFRFVNQITKKIDTKG